MMDKRDKYWDLLKGLAIILVLIGHSVQYGKGIDYLSSRSYLDNPIFMAIYGFHMPLFMFISGYFFLNSVKKRNFREILINCFKTLYIPILTFSLLEHFVLGFDLSLQGIIQLFAKSIYGSTYTLWFLSAVIMSQVSVGLVCKFLKDSWIYYALFTLILYIMPDYFQLAQAKFVYPFFLLGYFAHKYDWPNLAFRYSKQIGITSLVIYGLMMCTLFNKDTYVYFTKVSLFSTDNLLYQMYCDALRLVIGFFGIIGAIGISQWIYRVKEKTYINLILQRLGMITMGIYCFQDFLIATFVKITPPQ